MINIGDIIKIGQYHFNVVRFNKDKVGVSWKCKTSGITEMRWVCHLKLLKLLRKAA